MSYAHRSLNSFAALPFISTWRTGTVYTGSTANNQIKLPLEVAGTYKFTVNWGDSTTSVITAWDQAETLHTYPSPGDYIVTITGFIKGWDWGGGGTVAPTTGDMRKLLTVTQFGCLRFVNKADSVAVLGAFYGCTNLNLTAVQDMPNFKGATSTIGFFRLCSAITTVNNINKWDVSRVTSFRSTFREAVVFNDNIGNWYTGNAITLGFMFNVSLSPFGVFNNGNSDSIKNWDTSKVIQFNSTFAGQKNFNREVGLWNISSATTLNFMFATGAVAANLGIFNNAGSPSINNWDTSNVTNMGSIFQGQRLFNQPIGNWNTSKVTIMSSMFYASFVSGFPGVFNQDIGNWDTSNVTTMQNMFYYQAAFNQNLGNWNTGNVTIMSFMFGTIGSGAFNNGGSDSIKNWNTSKVTLLTQMFQNQNAFNQNIGNWDVSKVTSFSAMFSNTGNGVFNNGGSDSIKNWNTSSATTIRAMFQRQPNFNQEIGLWNVGNVTDMAFLLAGGIDKAFNNAGSPSIGNWDVSKVTNMTSAFLRCNLFDQNLGAWNTANVITIDGAFACQGAPGIFNNGGSDSIKNWNLGNTVNFEGMFNNQSLFNQPIGSWNVSKATNMANLFISATSFDQPIGDWNVSLVTNFTNFMLNKTDLNYSAANYDALLIGWASRPVRPSISINFGTIKRTAASTAARAILTSAPNNWTIIDGGI